jgi:hypothetical protein
MARHYGFTEDTLKNLIIDSGAVYVGRVFDETTGTVTTPGTLLGATKGGSKFTIESEYRTLEFDGARGPVKGGRRITKSGAKLETNLIGQSIAAFLLAIPGAASTAAPSTGTALYHALRRSLALAAANYSASIALVGEVSGSSSPVEVHLFDVLQDGNFELEAKDKEESVLKLTFTAHFAADDLDTEPWAVYYPVIA